MDDLTAVAAAFAALVAIGGALYYLFKWEPVPKTWCVILYHVARETNASFDWPNPGSVSGVNALDEKLDQVVRVLDDLPCASVLTFVKTKLLGPSFAPQEVDWEDVHVVYRAVWNDAPFRPAGKRARARIVTWRPGAPTIPDDLIFGSAIGSDRDGFLQWAYQNCPADHYALFYWGHSIGPGGLFNLNNSVKFPQLPAATGLAPASVVDVATTLQVLKDLRDNKQLTISPPARVATTPSSAAAPSSGGSSPSSGSSATPAPGGSAGPAGAAVQPVTPPRKVDVVLFQDCWMSTLETAFELQDLARYVIASQSLVPIGYTYVLETMTDPRGPVWPYEGMIGSILANPTNFIDSVSDHLKTFYDKPESRAPFPAAVVSVLDLGLDREIQTVVQPPIRELVRALSMLSSDPYARAWRWAFLVKAGQTYTVNANGTLGAGDWALRDVVALCTYLSVPANHPPGVDAAVSSAVQNAASTALAAIAANAGQYSLVKTAFTCATTPPAAAFGGVSILWMPYLYAAIPPNDEYLAKQIDVSFYKTLRLVGDTRPLLAAPTGDTWATFAFEQLF
jgi:cysteine peptidase C11 family protein